MDKKWGGKRKGAGRPKGKPASYLSVRLETEKLKQLKEQYGKELPKVCREWIYKIPNPNS